MEEYINVKTERQSKSRKPRNYKKHDHKAAPVWDVHKKMNHHHHHWKKVRNNHLDQ